jgi:hypothetical protein
MLLVQAVPSYRTSDRIGALQSQPTTRQSFDTHCACVESYALSGRMSATTPSACTSVDILSSSRSRTLPVQIPPTSLLPDHNATYGTLLSCLVLARASFLDCLSLSLSSFTISPCFQPQLTSALTGLPKAPKTRCHYLRLPSTLAEHLLPASDTDERDITYNPVQLLRLFHSHSTTSS